MTKNNMNGIVIVDKPQDWTSQDVTARLRRVFNTRRIGHGGTLDPMATGVLPVFVGRATRGVEFFEHAEKTYEAVLQLGITTDTEDITGTVLEKREVALNEQDFLNILPGFRGEIQQVPPMYSALKINGQKLCDLARQGKEVERKPRTITIHKLECLEFTGETARLLVHCSKGTYIRTLCKDIGEALGCGGCMASLRRVTAGEYTIEEAVPLQELLDTDNPEHHRLSALPPAPDHWVERPPGSSGSTHPSSTCPSYSKTHPAAGSHIPGHNWHKALSPACGSPPFPPVSAPALP